MDIFMKTFLLLVLTTGVTSLTLQDINVEWFAFKSKFNMTYDTGAEENYRYTVFTENLKFITVHNMAADKGRYTYWLGINQFSDLTSREFNKIYANLRIDASLPKKHTYAKNKTKQTTNLVSLPREKDWRDTNCVTHVKNQGKCGSCYAFAVTGAVESQKCLKSRSRKLVSLSEQNIIDCTSDKTDYGNRGCEGGNVENSYSYVEKKGLDTERSYPYKGLVGKCDQQEGVKAVDSIYEYETIWPFGNVAKLQRAVAEKGPISVYLSIDSKTKENKFKNYEKGVYANSECGSNLADLNHAVLLVAYGETPEGQGYWIIKNSYGTDWGIKGYMKLVRNGENTCGIATRASYPIMPE